jgi:hypothetical protein
MCVACATRRREYIRTYFRKYYAKHVEKLRPYYREKTREWRAAHPEANALYQRAYRARKKELPTTKPIN